jgi:hypothetical protein
MSMTARLRGRCEYVVATSASFPLWTAGVEAKLGGVMLLRGVIISIVAVLLSGCVSDRTGFDYAAITQKIGPPKPGQSRIVVLQEKAGAVSLSYCICDMKLDGTPIGTVKPGSYVYADRPAGVHVLSATETLFPGETKRDITTGSGRTHFFLARAGQRHDTVTGMALAGGLVGAAVASVATAGSDNPGPADLYPLEETAARTTLAGLQLAE